MHDPMVVAFEIRRPWPKRGSAHKMANGKTHRYWPAIVTVWHVEPGAADALTVCEHTSHWQWHVHHWRIQVPPFQALRRRLLTRCAECGGRSTKSNPANIAHQWERDRAPWWRGEVGLYHRECSTIVSQRARERYEREGGSR